MAYIVTFINLQRFAVEVLPIITFLMLVVSVANEMSMFSSNYKILEVYTWCASAVLYRICLLYTSDAADE